MSSLIYDLLYIKFQILEWGFLVSHNVKQTILHISRVLFNVCILLPTGKIDLEELIRAFKELGIEIAREEATKLLQRYCLIITHPLSINY